MSSLQLTDAQHPVPLSQPDKFCTFYVHEHYFGINVNQVAELVPAQPARPVPQAPPEICGLINLRGQIVTAYDLRQVLGFPPRSEQESAVSVLAAADGEVVSLLVDRIGEIVEIGSDRSELPLHCVSAAVGRMLDTTYQLESQLLLTLDIDRLVTIESNPESLSCTEAGESAS